MDETRIVANQRFDLIDQTRLIAQLQEAYGDILGRLLGNPKYFSGAAVDQQRRPLIVYNFDCSQTAALQITVKREWVSGGLTYNAHVYDKDGQRLTGPNSSTSQIFSLTTPAAVGAGVDRFLIARRVANSTTSEVRRFYSAASGKTAAATNTRTLDSWEVADAFEVTGLNSPANTSAVLSAAGWIDIATYQTNGAIITSVTALDPDILGIRPLTWVLAPPVVDFFPLNLGELLGALQQLIERIRHGTGGTSRNWYDNPSYDGCFEEEGGVRFAGGTALTLGLQDAYIRGYGLGGTSPTIYVSDDAFTNADNLHMMRAKAFIAGNNTSTGAPDTTNKSGFLYASNKSPLTFPTNLQAVDKFWSVDCSGMLPTNNGGAPGIQPWAAVGAASANDSVEWYLTENLVSYTTMVWIPSNSVTTTGALPVKGGLQVPLKLPDKCLLQTVYIDGTSSGMPAGLQICAYVLKRVASTGVISILNNGGAPTPVNYGAVTFNHPEAIAANTIIDNSVNHYWLSITIYTTGAIGPVNPNFIIEGARILTRIREASHVY